jgi:YHS domain-containing protein
MAWVIRILVILLVIRALWKLIKGILEGAGYLQAGSAAQRSVKLERDPVCGVFVTPSRALVARARGETAYFCSEKCRTVWERR